MTEIERIEAAIEAVSYEIKELREMLAKRETQTFEQSRADYIDRCAIAAMSGMLANRTIDNGNPLKVSTWSYEYALAMWEERGKHV